MRSAPCGEILGKTMAEKRILSCFIDESGDFGDYDSHSPYYIVSVVLHDQKESIEGYINGLETYLSQYGYSHHSFHTAPLVRREADYSSLDIKIRKRLFNQIYNFTRKLPISFFCCVIRKSECQDSEDLETKLTKAISNELHRNDEYFRSFDKIILYYDNGQKTLKKILNIIFNSIFSDAEVRKVEPVDYRLFQVADLICTLELIMKKAETVGLSKSETEFFHTKREFKKEYWKKIDQMRV